MHRRDECAVTVMEHLDCQPCSETFGYRMEVAYHYVAPPHPHPSYGARVHLGNENCHGAFSTQGLHANVGFGEADGQAG